MNFKRHITLAVVAIGMLLATASANAADCESATVVRLGVNPANTFGGSNYFAQLDCANDSVWAGTVSFYLSSDLGDSGLATLLTATSLGQPVWVRTAGITTGSLVTVVYMNAP